MAAFEQVIGAVLVLVVLADIFFSVLYPASGRGPLREPLTRVVWGALRAAAGLLPERRRHGLLAYSGPLVITATMLMWGAVLVTGWALIIRPALGQGITTGSRTDVGWGTAFYYSAAVLTTLGPGSLSPGSTGYRMLEVTQAAIGMLGLTMVVTYFLSVYGGVTARKTFASALHLRTGGTGDAARLLTALSTGGRLSDARGYLTDIGDKLLEMQQTHRSYPVLRYFHFRQARYALPRILLIALDAVSLLEAALGPREAARVVSTATLVELRDGALALLDELVPGAGGPPPAERVELWHRRYRDALTRLRQADISLPQHADEAAERYAVLRERWDEQLRVLAHAMAYPWPQIDCTPPSLAHSNGS